MGSDDTCTTCGAQSGDCDCSGGDENMDDDDMAEKEGDDDEGDEDMGDM